MAKLKAMGFQNVHIESFPVDGWTRGEERASVVSPSPQRLLITALGNSAATPPDGIEAEIALFHTYADFLAQAPGALKGKIAVVTQPMVRAQDGSGYGMINAMRTLGPVEAEKRGAVGYMIRSLATGDLRSPHTGASRPAHIPAVALAVPDAEQLDRLVALGKPVRVRLISTPHFEKGATADTVIGEIPGREKPDEIVLIGGHLDSWDLGTGAIDDGAGRSHHHRRRQADRRAWPRPPHHPRRPVRGRGAELLQRRLRQGPSGGRAGPAHYRLRVRLRGRATLRHRPARRRPRSRLWQGAGQCGRAPEHLSRSPGGATMAARTWRTWWACPWPRWRQDGTHYFDFHHTPDDVLDRADPHQMDKAVAAWAAFTYLAADTDVDFRAIAAAAPPAPTGRRP